jgi:predicted GNAT family acetyltransferase
MSAEVTRRTSDYEITVDGTHAGLAAFVERDGATVFTHTEIDDAFEGQGIGGQLARAALDDVRARGSKVIPECSFIRGWIDKHPDYQDLVQATDRSDGQA